MPCFFKQHNSKELNSGSPLPTQFKVFFILKTKIKLYIREKLKNEAVNHILPGRTTETWYFIGESSAVVCDARRRYDRYYINM